MRRMAVALLLAVGLAAGVLWWSLRAGVSAGSDEDYFLTGLGIPALLCTVPQNSEPVVNTDASIGHGWGLGLMVPIPFLLVGLMGYLLYRSGLSDRPAKGGLDEWDS